MRALAMWALCCGLLTGCASTVPVRSSAPTLPALFADEHFAPPAERIDAAEVFALSDEMRTFLHEDMAGALRTRGSLQALAEALYRKSALKLEYDATTTRTAAQAFAARAGNCLSLVVMTAAFAKELGLRVTYQSALSEETWSRAEQLYLLSGHINIALHRGMAGGGLGRMVNDGVMIDFLPQAHLRGLRTQEISESTVVAMFMNNRAAEALVQGRVDDAYWWARSALAHDAAFAPALNILGVVYKQRQHLALAQRVLEHAVQLRPEHAPALANLIGLLRSIGQTQQADVLAARLVHLEPVAPFHFFHLGQAAMQAGDYANARDFFAREVRRADYNHEFHFWLAQAYFKLGEFKAAHKHLALAMQHSTTRDSRDVYAAKLARLKQLEMQ